MNGTSRLRLSNAASDKHLDVRRFDLDVHDGSTSDRGERFRKGGNTGPIGEGELLEVQRRELSDGLLRRSLLVSGVDYRVVMNNDYPVAGRVDVELNAFRTELDGALERGERVLGMSLVCSSVGDPLWRIAARTYGQAFLSVVALCSMSAKQ